MCELQYVPAAIQKSEVSSTPKVRTIPVRSCCFPTAIARRQQLPQLGSLKVVGIFLHTPTEYRQIQFVSVFLKGNWPCWNFLSILVSGVCLLFEADCPGARASCSHSTGRTRAHQPAKPATVVDWHFANTLDYSHALYHWFFLHKKSSPFSVCSLTEICQINIKTPMSGI